MLLMLLVWSFNRWADRPTDLLSAARLQLIAAPRQMRQQMMIAGKAHVAQQQVHLAGLHDCQLLLLLLLVLQVSYD